MMQPSKTFYTSTQSFIIERMLPEEESAIAISYHVHQTQYGSALIANTRKGICFIAFGDGVKTLEELKMRFPKGIFHREETELQFSAVGAIDQYGALSVALPLHLKGSDFEMRVWQALLQTQKGMLTTYGEIARTIGAPQAVRAVASAIGRNPIACLIPCHRVLRADGKLGGYHWGIDIKRKMIDWERASILP
ncbi:MAG: methylated-DNA--[protein]-cysteine S-methyltransferase [Dysgonomonadaceae bacterium]|nr:methylated-DNA--[protein]-cysteine S-methyltransferase [Dysgonamonadaceae bacterium]